MSTAPITKILAQLTKVRQRQPSQYSACCPAHDDKNLSLSVRETSEGDVLLYCVSGCPGRQSKEIATMVPELAIWGRALYQSNDGGFLVWKCGYIHRAIDFADLQAFARRLGVTQ